MVLYSMVYSTIIYFVAAGERQISEARKKSEQILRAVCEKGKVRNVHSQGQSSFVMFSKMTLI